METKKVLGFFVAAEQSWVQKGVLVGKRLGGWGFQGKKACEY